MSAMTCKYRILNAPSANTIDWAGRIGCNWVIAHSAGIEYEARHPKTGRELDAFPIYFEDYPKVAQARHYQDSVWIEPMRRETVALCSRAVDQGLKVAWHMYEPSLPWIFEREYPEIVSTWNRPTQTGVSVVHSHMHPDNPDVWTLIRNKYAEMAREFPLVDMFILTTWDGNGSRWCIPQAKMPIPQRFVSMVKAAQEGVDSVRKGVTICFRLWGRNWPYEMYTDSHRLIGECCGLPNASELMDPCCRPYNDPRKILPEVLAALPKAVPIMYKSTQFDIADAQPLTWAVGQYPAERDQILEVSYEQYHKKPWPWCKMQHIRKGLEAVAQSKLAGWLALPINMGNNDRECQPDRGNLGRMNTWLLNEFLMNPTKPDATLVAAWLEKEFGSPQPKEFVDVLLEADDIVDKGIQWGGGVVARQNFASLHTTKLYWFYDGFIDPKFPYKMANPTRQTIDAMLAMKHEAYERACRNIEKIKAAAGQAAPSLVEELLAAYASLRDYILLIRDWHCYLLMQYAIERGLYEPSRQNLGRMSRYVEQFIKNMVDLRETEAGKRVMRRIDFPDGFPLT